MSYVSGINIVPLLQNLYALPQLQFSFEMRVRSVSDEPLDCMNEMFVERVEAWRKYVGRPVMHVRLFLGE